MLNFAAPKKDKSRSLKSKLMQKLQKKREGKSSGIKTMTVDEMYEQNERVKPLIEQLEQKEAITTQIESYLDNESPAINRHVDKAQANDPHSKLDSHSPASKLVPPETAAEFLKNEGSARIFTVPQLTATHGDASDDVFLCFLYKREGDPSDRRGRRSEIFSQHVQIHHPRHPISALYDRYRCGRAVVRSRQCSEARAANEARAIGE